MNQWKTVALAIVTMLLGACGGKYNIQPDLYLIKQGAIEPITAGSNPAVAIINSYSQSQPVHFYTERLLGGSKYEYHGDLQKWTDNAVQIVGRELVKMGFSVNKGPTKKSLTLTITETEFLRGRNVQKQEVNIAVKLGDGAVLKFMGRGVSGAPFGPKTVEQTTESGITKALMRALEDQKVRAYLSI